MLNKFVLMISISSLLACLYYFFVSPQLLYGSLAFILCVAANCLYAMLVSIDMAKKGSRGQGEEKKD